MINQKLSSLPNDLLILIFTFLDIENVDILILRKVSISINKLLLKNISVNHYPFLKNNSFFRKSVRKRIFNKEIKKKWNKANDMYEKTVFDMLLTGNWL